MSSPKAQQPVYKPSHKALRDLNRLERSSSDLPDQLTSLLSRKNYGDYNFLKSLQSEDKGWLIEYLDNVLNTLDSVGPAYQECLRVLRWICYIEERLPRSYMLDVSLLPPIADPSSTGPYETLYEGSLNGAKVCAKKLRASFPSGSVHLGEVVTWKRLKHPNIVSFLGVTHEPFHFVSAWILGMELSTCITNHPGINRLDLLIGIADGLNYLHSHHVTHGDLGGPNIIVDNSGHPYITGFGLVHMLSRFTEGQICRCMRWAAPSFQSYLMEADVFSFAMVMVEVFTGQVPFFPKSDSEAQSAAERGERPERPTHADLTDKLWQSMEQCWDEDPEKRPKMSVVSRILYECRNDNQVLAPVPSPTNWLSQITNEILDLTDQVASVALFGSIGVGKSFVARTVLAHGRTKAKFGENRHFVRCDNLENSPESFTKRLSEAIRIDTIRLKSHFQSSPPLILLFDGVDSVLDSLTPEAEEIRAMIEEFGSYEHICLVTTSRIYPDVHGFHRIEVPTPPEEGARDIFYSLCNLGKSPAVDAVIVGLDCHPFSIELLARSTRVNGWDEQMFLKAWGDQRGILRMSYYQKLKDTVEPVFCSPRIKELGTTARKVLEAIASFQPGIEEHRLEGFLPGIDGVREVVDVLCKFSLVYRRDGVLKMLLPLQFYLLKSMLAHAETEEVIRWGPDCMPARGVCPVYTQGPPDGWLRSPSPSSFHPTIRRPRREWIRRLLQIVQKRFLALFVRRIVPIIQVDLQEDPADILPAALQENPTIIPPTAAPDDRANTPPTTAQEGCSNIPPTAVQEGPADMSPANAQENVANMPLTAPRQQIPPELTAYEIGW